MSAGFVLHEAAGLTISATAPIPGLPRAAHEGPADLQIHLESRPAWPSRQLRTIHTSTDLDSSGRPLVTVKRGDHGYQFTYVDGTTAWIDRHGTEVWCTSAPGATLADTATYLTGPILGFALRRRGALSLHASAVTVSRGALLMVGGHGRGKSTTAAALTRRGCALITDDVMHLRCAGSEWIAEPFAAGLRLWPQAVTLLLGPDVVLPRLTPTWDKRVLEVSSFDVTASPRAVPVRAIAFLEPRDAELDAPRLSSIGAAEAVVALAANSSASHLLDREARAAEFTLLGHLVGRVRCVRAVASDRTGTLRPFADLLYAWAAEGTAPDGG